MRTEDGYTIQQCLDGDSAAFGLLVEKYKKGIYALAYSRIDNFMGWLYRITTNQCKDWIRSSSRRPDGAFAEDQEPYVVNRPYIPHRRDGEEDTNPRHAESDGPALGGYR